MFQPNVFKFNASGRVREIIQLGVRCYSRKSSSHQTGPFKIVSKARDGDDFMKTKLHHNENWELFGQDGFRFYMPGNVGPAWHDNVTASFIPSTLPSRDHMELECIIQDCPVLLRSGVEELFQSADSSTPLTIVTLVQKGVKPKNELDVERQTKEFIWAAQEICGKLRAAGYWADFINPFSGVPFYSSSPQFGLYKTDQRFRCHGFHITAKGDCKIISPSNSHKYIGNLFTTAPSSTDKLRNILKTYESIDIYPK